MKLYPAIDLRGGQAVRLYQGDYDQMTVYNADPAAQAREFIAAGAKYLHVVDLDGAKDDTTANRRTIAAIAALGGFFAVMDYLCGSWSYSIAEFGWLSIALVIFTVWRPWLSIIGSILFGALYTLSSKLNVSITIQPLFEMIPYVVTIIVLVFTSVRNRRENQPPASLGLAYFREER